MYARHLAWLSATPKDKEQSRREMYSEGSPQLEMISLSPYEQHLLELWFECGTVTQGAGGLLPLEWDVIIKWANKFYSETYIEWVEHPKQSKRHKSVYTPVPITQCVLLDSELQVIRRMSQSYVSEYNEANDSSRPCPKEIMIGDMTEEEALNNADAILQCALQMFGKQDTSIEEVQNK